MRSCESRPPGLERYASSSASAGLPLELLLFPVPALDPAVVVVVVAVYCNVESGGRKGCTDVVVGKLTRKSHAKPQGIRVYLAAMYVLSIKGSCWSERKTANQL